MRQIDFPLLHYSNTPSLLFIEASKLDPPSCHCLGLSVDGLNRYSANP